MSKKQTKDKKNIISTEEALKCASDVGVKASSVTMVTWFWKYKLGVKIGGRLHYDINMLNKFLAGELND